LNGDENELALTLLDIVELLQYPLSVLQKARRHALASPLLIASEQMPPLESADRHPAPSQKLLIKTGKAADEVRNKMGLFVAFKNTRNSKHKR